jgi:hypothetical protein
MKLFNLVFCLLIAFSPLASNAEHFNCDLKLNLLPDSSSSELKQLIFDVDVQSNNKGVMTGTMITTSCFSTINEPFTSDTSKFKKVTIGDLTHGTFKNPSLSIGMYHYQLNLKFAQLTKSPEDAKSIDFIATGKIIPLDNDVFIHQNARGECHLTKDQNFSMNFLTMPPERCK